MIQDGTHKIGVTMHPVRKTPEAAMLLTLGVPFAGDNIENLVSNVYCDGKPYQPGAPGVVTYLMAGRAKDGTLAADLRDAFAKGGCDALLDALVNEIEAAHPALGNRLRILLPLALASYAAGFFANRERILDLWKRARPQILIQKSEKSFVLIDRNATAETRKHYGV